ncbi:STAS domain-containing protein [Parafrankia elaeagni]|uniref:STAS domain-containing protein n=1 Tax=Parafrankia elaeagni TaxID=222534 RepID=UPI0012B5CC3A|nr:STAS domain-containing protein [Parafrankia elaeagni]
MSGHTPGSEPDREPGSESDREPGRVRAVGVEPAESGGSQTLRIVGTVDVRSVGELRTLLHAAIDAGRGPLHVNVGGLELTDHAGVGVLLGGARRARSIGRSLVLLDVSAALWPLLAVDRLGRLLRVRPAADTGGPAGTQAGSRSPGPVPAVVGGVA